MPWRSFPGPHRRFQNPAGAARLTRPGRSPAPPRQRGICPGRPHATRASIAAPRYFLLTAATAVVAVATAGLRGQVAWIERKPAHSPPARTYHAMACDMLRGKVVLFGGEISQGNRLGDTWEWTARIGSRPLRSTSGVKRKFG